MRKDITVPAEVRESRGKNEARRMRVSGTIPAVVYGSPGESVALRVVPREVNAILKSSTGRNTIFNLAVEGGETSPVMIVDAQYDPVRTRLLHADFKRIDLTKKIEVNVPVHYLGDPKGVKLQGGLLDVVTRAVGIECLPDDIPEHFNVDVVELLVGQAVRASDLPMAASMRLTSPADAVLVHIIGQKTEEAPAEAAAAEGDKKGKDAKGGKKK